MSSSESEEEEEEEEEEEKQPSSARLIPAAAWGNKRRMSKQMSMKETTREAAWERRRRRQVMRKRRIAGIQETSDDEAHDNGGEANHERRKERKRSLTDEDLDELKGFMDLGFRFKEEEGCDDLCNTLPALNLYFAVNRQFSESKLHQTPLSPVSTPTTLSGGESSSSLFGSPNSRSSNQHGGSDSWKILQPGDNPQLVKTRIRHWAQAVAYSMRQFGYSS